MGRLEHNQRPLIAGKLLQPTESFTLHAREEPFKDEPAWRKPRDRQRGYYGRGPRYDINRKPLVDAAPDQPVTGVGEAGHPGIRYQDDVSAGPDPRQQSLSLPSLISVVVND